MIAKKHVHDFRKTVLSEMAAINMLLLSAQSLCVLLRCLDPAFLLILQRKYKMIISRNEEPSQ